MKNVRVEELCMMLIGIGYNAGDIRQAIEFGKKTRRRP